MTNQKPPEPAKEALLTEYEACQHDNDSSSLSYWTLAGIFIGVSSALLAGLIYGLLSNSILFQILLKVLLRESVPNSESRQIVALSIVILVLGAAIIIILKKLKQWLRRVRFLQQLNYERLREIELELGMWKSWRVHSIDEWQDIQRGKPCDNKIWNIIGNKLKENLNIKYSELLDKREYAVTELVKPPYPAKYERPTSRGVFNWILRTIISLWIIFLGFSIALMIMACLN